MQVPQTTLDGSVRTKLPPEALALIDLEPVPAPLGPYPQPVSLTTRTRSSSSAWRASLEKTGSRAGLEKPCKSDKVSARCRSCSV